MGYTRTARRTGRREETRNHQGGYRQEDLHRGVQPHLPRSRHGVHRHVGEPDPKDGILGQHGRPLHHLRQQVHRVAVVAPQAALRQGTALQGLHHSALLARGRNRALDPRAEPARLLPRRQGYDGRGTVPHPQPQARNGGLGNPCLPGLDHHALDPALEYGPLRRPENRLRGRAQLQPLYR